MGDEERQSQGEQGDRADRGEQQGESWQQKYSEVETKLGEVKKELQTVSQRNQETAEKLNQSQDELQKLRSQQETTAAQVDSINRQQLLAKPTGSEAKPNNDAKLNDSSEKSKERTPGSGGESTKQPVSQKPVQQPAVKPQHRRRSI
jgi:DNA anti-recombination protein RmuC